MSHRVGRKRRGALMAVSLLLTPLFAVVQPVGAAPDAGRDRAFVTAAYTDFLDRAPSAAEMSAALARGPYSAVTARATLVSTLAHTPEWIGVTVERLYQDTLGRPADEAGKTYWVGLLATGKRSVAQVGASFYASDEYFAGFGKSDPATWVDDLYRKILERDSDAGGRAFWMARIVTAGRLDVAYSFYQSAESRRTRVTALYDALLGRQPDITGLTYWSERVLTTGDLALAADLASSAEYYRRAWSRFGSVQVSSLSAGGAHTCALISDGSVRCWGSNSNGQLGSGTRTDSAQPVTVRGLNDATAVSAGSRHTCAVTLDGGVRCWGAGARGQLGDGRKADSTTPVAVAGLTGVVAVSAGADHSCALLFNGGSLCWGAGEVGQLGNGQRLDAATPVFVSGLTGAKALGAGSAQTCAVTSGGGVKCWGANDFGQLGNATTVSSDVPVAVRGLTGLASDLLSGVSAVAGGFGHTCALASAGKVDCWGANDKDQLGTGGIGDPKIPAPVFGLSGATALSAGTNFTCALVTGGAVRCWGANDSGQLGTTADALGPGSDQVAGLSGAVAIATGGAHACALEGDGTVWCWGSNTLGQRGPGTPASGSGVALVPVLGGASGGNT